jgi:predicted TIM-barrel fold metal-dependent hydrolase
MIRWKEIHLIRQWILANLATLPSNSVLPRAEAEPGRSLQTFHILAMETGCRTQKAMSSMKTRREVLRLIPTAVLAGTAGAAAPPEFTRVDTHVHIHREAPALLSAMKEANWRGLDIVVCPASGGETFDLEEKLRATRKVSRDSGGTLAWASTFDARGFEEPDFTERTIARLRQSFADGAIGVKIWKNIGMSIKGKSGAYLLADDRALRPVYEAILKADRTLVAHLAEPDGAWLPLDAKNPELRYYSNNPQWHMYGKTGAPVKEDILKARDRVLALYPKLRVVGCHLGSDEDDLGRLARRLDAFPNFAVDTAARVRYFARGDRDQVRQFLARYQDRILYATDFSLREGEPAAAARGLQVVHNRDWTFFSGADSMEYDGKPTRGLALSEGILRKLFRENAIRWLPGIDR